MYNVAFERDKKYVLAQDISTLYFTNNLSFIYIFTTYPMHNRGSHYPADYLPSAFRVGGKQKESIETKLNTRGGGSRTASKRGRGGGHERMRKFSKVPRGDL